MKKLTAQLVHVENNSNYTGEIKYYKLNSKITKGCNGLNYKVDILEDLEKATERLKPEYKYIKNQLTEGAELIAISDACTHLERLVFVAYKTNKNTYGFLSSLCIGGVNTFLIHGGDKKSMKSPEVYLRILARQNNMKFGGIIK